jgi:hypothetical protein
MGIGWFPLATLIWLQSKHFVADYMLQPAWMISGKGHFAKPGGYVHAGIHAIGTMPVLWMSMPNVIWALFVGAGEFVIHFVIDHCKAVHGRQHPHPTNSRMFWTLHGLDQLAHHLTYSAILAVIIYGHG